MGGTTNGDGQLAVELLTDICKPKERNGNTAIGLAFAPIRCQRILDEYISSVEGLDSERALIEGLKASGANEDVAVAHLPIFRFAKKKRHVLLALAPDLSDLETINKGGLQSLSPDRRDIYVAVAEGF